MQWVLISLDAWNGVPHSLKSPDSIPTGSVDDLEDSSQGHPDPFDGTVVDSAVGLDAASHSCHDLLGEVIDSMESRRPLSGATGGSRRNDDPNDDLISVDPNLRVGSMASPIYVHGSRLVALQGATKDTVVGSGALEGGTKKGNGSPVDAK
jgi:hypothetical protein